MICNTIRYVSADRLRYEYATACYAPLVRPIIPSRRGELSAPDGRKSWGLADCHSHSGSINRDIADEQVEDR